MASESQFPIPFGADDLRNDLLVIHLFHLRVSSLFGTDRQVFGLIGKPLPPGYREGTLWAADNDAAAYELTAHDILETTFSRALEQQYAFAFHGVLTTGLEPMDYETMHTWVAAYLMDMRRSALSTEWEGFGFDCDDALERCLHTSELANARLTLEGRGYFSYFQRVRPGTTGEEATAIDALTIRQVALLAGMEEMSVRTAASRKGPNQLTTYKEDGRTLVRCEDAREWLKAKNRYLPVTRKWDGPRLQLDRVRFETLYDVEEALQNHLTQQAIEKPDGDMRNRVKALLASRGLDMHPIMTPQVAADPQLLHELAVVMQLPDELFCLRVEQAFHSNRLRMLEQEIKKKLHQPG